MARESIPSAAPPGAGSAPRSPAPTSFAARIALIAAGIALFALLEGVLAIAGLGGARDRGDPFLGFSQEYAIFVPSPNSARLVTDSAKRESFNEQSFAREKPAGLLRIFCLGGSATYGFPRGADAAFPAMLGEKLARAFPERRFEVVNVGGLSYAAFRCVNVAREVARYAPDAIVYYDGNNEYVERRFFRSLLDEPAWRRGLRARLNRLRTYTLLKKAIQGTIAKGRPQTWSGEESELFGVRVLREDNEALPRSADEDRAIEESFAASLRQMGEIAREAGARFVIGVPAVNQSDWPPGLSLHDPSKDAAALSAFDERMEEATRLRAAGDMAGAARALEAAVAIDSRYAAAHFELGGCYHALGESDKARAEFRAAIATDGLPIRATPRIQEIAREVARDAGAIRVDVDSLLMRASADNGGIIGRQLFIDYCHPTTLGHERIADAMFAALAGTLVGAASASATPAPLARASSGGAPSDSAFAAGAPPDSSSAFGIAWEGQMLVRQGRFADAEARFREALALDPELSYALEGMGRCLIARGDSAGAIGYYEHAARVNPSNPTILTNLANAYLAVGRMEDSERAIRAAIEADPNSSGARVLLAGILARTGRATEARASLEAAVAASPTNVEARKALARTLADANDFAAAEPHLREAVRLDPQDAALGYAHALALLQLNRPDEALVSLDAVIARNADFYPAIGAAGVIRMNRGDRAQAVAHFRRVLELHPGDPLATKYLAALEDPRGVP
jgi:tetratricopeptide (TPR) repeat protein